MKNVLALSFQLPTLKCYRVGSEEADCQAFDVAGERGREQFTRVNQRLLLKSGINTHA